MTKLRSFLICPVRGRDAHEFADAVASLEAEGYDVHWPTRDTNQGDQIGHRICRENAAAIAKADVVHVIWDGKSQGCLFDLGVAFALQKPLKIIDIPENTPGRSFQSMLRCWAEKQPAFADAAPLLD